jgi:hypothetical protein
MENKNLLIGAGVVIVGYLLWKKSKSKVNRTQNSENEKKLPSKIGGNALPVIELDWQILSKIPNEFTVKSKGFNTRYYKNIDKTLAGFDRLRVPDVYSQSFRTDGSIGGTPPRKISVREFSDAYLVFLKQPK